MALSTTEHVFKLTAEPNSLKGQMKLLVSNVNTAASRMMDGARSELFKNEAAKDISAFAKLDWKFQTLPSEDINMSRSPNKRKRGTRNPRRVSFIDNKSIVEVTGASDLEKKDVWYGIEDYNDFILRAQRDAKVLKDAAAYAESPESLFSFIQNNPDLCPRGLEKVLTYEESDDEEEDDDEQRGGRSESHTKRMKRQKAIHRRIIVSMHRFQKENGQQNPDEIRKFSENSSKWAVDTALKLGHIDAAGLI